MAPEITGSVVRVDALASSGSASVTVPSDAEACVAMYSHYNDGGGGADTLLTLTLGGSDMVVETEDYANEQVGTDLGLDEPGVGVQFLSTLPGTGSKTVAWSWNGDNRDEGGALYFIFLKKINPYRRFRSFAYKAQGSSNVDVAISLAVKSTDLVIGLGQSFITNTLTSSSGIASTLLSDNVYNSQHTTIVKMTAVEGTVDLDISVDNFNSTILIAFPSDELCVFEDDFNRSDSNLGATPEWLDGLAELKIVSNLLTYNIAVGGNDGHGVLDTSLMSFPADQWAEADFPTIAGGAATTGLGFILRYVAGSGGSFIRVVFSDANGTEIAKIVNGTYTSLATIDLGTLPLTDGMRIRVEIVGSTIYIYTYAPDGISGILTPRLVYQNTFNFTGVTAAGNPGAAYSANAGATATMNNYKAGIVPSTRYVSSLSSIGGPGASSVSVNAPADRVAGDHLYFALILASGQIGTVVPPAGVVQVGSWSDGEIDTYPAPALGVFYILDNGSTNPYSFTLNMGGSRGGILTVHRFRGNAAYIQSVNGLNSASGSARSSPEIDATPGNLIAAFVGGSAVDQRFELWTGGFEERYEDEYYGINCMALAKAYVDRIATVTVNGSTQSYWKLVELGSVAYTPAGDAGPTLIRLIGNRQSW